MQRGGTAARRELTNSLEVWSVPPSPLRSYILQRRACRGEGQAGLYVWGTVLCAAHDTSASHSSDVRRRGD